MKIKTKAQAALDKAMAERGLIPGSNKPKKKILKKKEKKK